MICLYTKKMAFDKGAADFINKSVSMEELVERLKRVLCNKTYYNKIPDIEVLTEREIEILTINEQVRDFCIKRIKLDILSH